MWAHVMWQKHNLEPWEFIALSKRKQAYLMASELISQEKRPS